MAIQLAYRKTFGYCRGTYESTQTRTYLHGRTEVTRSVSKQSEAFCDAMTNGLAGPVERYDALQKACQQHSAFTGKSSKGLGLDRHLLGLKYLLKQGEPVPALYSDPAFTRSGTWALSTSGLAGEKMDGWGFGEVVPDGLGIGYSVQQDRLRYTVSSRHKWADRMCANLEAALLEMGALCKEQSLQKSKL